MVFNIEKLSEELNYFRLNYEEGHLSKRIPISEYLTAEEWSDNNSAKSKIFFQCCDELNIHPSQLSRNQFINWFTQTKE